MWLSGTLCSLIIIHECLCAAVSFSLSTELSQIQKLISLVLFLIAIIIFYYCTVCAGNESLSS